MDYNTVRNTDPNDIYCGLVGGKPFSGWPKDILYIVLEHTQEMSYSPSYDGPGYDSNTINVNNVERVFTSTEQLKVWANRNFKDIHKYKVFEIKREMNLKPVVSIDI